MVMLSVRINITAFIITMTPKLGIVHFLIKMLHYRNVVFQKMVLSPYLVRKGEKALVISG